MSIIGNAIMLGGGSTPANPTQPEKDVNFYDDYDGSLYASYTTAEFANLTAMPANPTHPGLTSQGWNWDLADAKTYVAANGMLNIGQSYVTNDNKTRIYVYLTAPKLSPRLSVAVNGTCTVDWGDGTTATTLTGTSTSTLKNADHTYAAEGGYCITLDVGQGQLGISGADGIGSKLLWGNSTTTISSFAYNSENAAYINAIIRIELGDNVKLNNYAFYALTSLRNITVPIGAITTVPQYSFSNNISLVGLTIPKGVTSFGTYAFESCGIAYVSIPQTNPTLGTYCFKTCSQLKTFAFPSGKTTTVDGVLYGNYTTVSVLSKVSLPSSIKTINQYSLFGLNHLSKITFSTTVTTIQDRALGYCYNLKEIHFKRTTPPTLSTSDAFKGLPASCVIYVPRGKLSAYTSATNYPSSSTYTYVEE